MTNLQSSNDFTWIFGICVLITAITFVIYHNFLKQPKRIFKNFPSPPRFPIFGNFLDMTAVKQEGWLGWLETRSVELGPNYKYDLLGFDIHIVGDPENVQHMLKNNFENYIKGPLLHDILEDLLGNGIFNVDGELWKSQRKTASHLFKVNTLKTFMHEVFVRHTQDLLIQLDQLVNTDQSFNIQPLFYKMTFDSIAEIAFGKKLNSFQEESKLSSAFDDTLKVLESRILQPFWKWLPEPTLKPALKVLDDFCHQTITERRNDKDIRNHSDLLSLYLTNTSESDKYLRDIMLNFLIAGRDTTGQTLTWLFYLLSQNPNIEETLVNEIHQVIGTQEIPTYEHLKNLKNMEAAINETLRLYPPVPFDTKYTVKEDTLPSGHHVGANKFVEWSAWILGRHPNYWDDPLKMKLERWTDEESKSSRHPYLFIPFQAAPRLCLGQSMAYLEVKIVASILLRKYRFKLDKTHPVHPIITITLNTKDGVKMYVYHR